MRKLLITLLVLFSAQSFGQDQNFQKHTRTLDARAELLATEYNKELDLDYDQFRLFSIKIEKFLNRRQNIESSLTGRPRLEALYHVRMQEIVEMQTVLTKEQLKTYDRVKLDLQPLTVRVQ